MRVGVYIDGFNLYYGARNLCGRSSPGWRWLDLRALTANLLPQSWEEATVERVVYCTARIDAKGNPSGAQDQDVYLKALRAAGAVDFIEYGNFVARVKQSPLATPDRKGRPVLTKSGWPVMVRDSSERPVPDAGFMVQHAFREEKGSDVNVAAHLLIDTIGEVIDAAVVVSNDSDLRLPIQHARSLVPVGTVNPSPNYLAGDLKGRPEDGVGGHWWRQLECADLYSAQMPDQVAQKYSRPAGW